MRALITGGLLALAAIFGTVLLVGASPAQQHTKYLVITGFCSTAPENRNNVTVVSTAYASSSLDGNPTTIPILVDHSHVTSSVIGHVVSITPVNGNVQFTAVLDENLMSPQLIERLKTGLIHSVSIGFLPIAANVIHDEEGAEHMVVYDMDLLEISLVMIPADAGAQLTSVVEQ